MEKYIKKKIGYEFGIFDNFRAESLEDLERKIQLSKHDGLEFFAVGVYDENVCQSLRADKPVKSLEERMEMAEAIRGVDFVFPVNSKDLGIVEKRIEEAYDKFVEKLQKEKENINKSKPYKLGYAPGTYDLFHTGHLENIRLAAQKCERLILGVKADELVFEHKKSKPIIEEDERMEILRHLKNVYGVYKYYTRDLHVASEALEKRYGQPVEAIFLGSDLQKDFEDTKDLNIIYTPRNPETMKTRSTSYYKTKCLNKPLPSKHISYKDRRGKLENMRKRLKDFKDVLKDHEF